MKVHAQSGKARLELSALFPIAALLIAGMAAKLGVITQLIHLTH